MYSIFYISTVMALVFCSSCPNDVFHELEPEERRQLYDRLGLSTEVSSDQLDITVLQEWAERNSGLVTKHAIITALDECDLFNARDRLIDRWNLQGTFLHVGLFQMFITFP